MKRNHVVLVRKILQAVAVALLVLSALLLSACGEEADLYVTTSTTIFPSQRSFMEELSGDGYGYPAVFVDGHGDTAVLTVWIAVMVDDETRAPDDAIFAHTVTLAEEYGVADSTGGRMRVGLFDGTVGGTIKDLIFASRDFDVSETTTVTQATASTTFATAKASTSTSARPVLEKQRMFLENDAHMPIIADEERYELIGETAEEQATFIASIAKSDKDGPIEVPLYRAEDLLLDNDACFTIGEDHGQFFWSNLRFDTFQHLELVFPSKAVRMLDDGMIYVMYDTESDGRVFIFFSEEKTRYAFVDGYPVLMKKTLSYEDFESLAVGDGIEQVQEIDPIVLKYGERLDTLNDTALANYRVRGRLPTSVHLLTDGILKIEYERDPELGYAITDIIYSQDFVLDGFNGETCYRIVDADYVD